MALRQNYHTTTFLKGGMQQKRISLNLQIWLRFSLRRGLRRGELAVSRLQKMPGM